MPGSHYFSFELTGPECSDARMPVASYVTNTLYTTAGQISSLSLGNTNLTESTVYNARLQPSLIQVQTAQVPSVSLMSLGYCYRAGDCAGTFSQPIRLACSVWLKVPLASCPELLSLYARSEVVMKTNVAACGPTSAITCCAEFTPKPGIWTRRATASE